MKYLIAILFSAIVSQAAFAQDYKKHKVAKGETITDIARKYQVTPYDIYRLNPDSKNGIKEDTVLLIPKQSKPQQSPEKEVPTKVANTVHEVQPKETLYSLAKRYDVTPESIRKANPGLKDSLQVGQQIVIPIKGSAVAAQVKEVKQEKKSEQTYFFHTVEPGDTKYGIAKKYGMSLQLLESLNPAVKDTLPLGYKLKLSKEAVVEKETAPVAAPAAVEYSTYTVQPKETFYSLTRRTGLSEAQIVALNPEAKDGLKDGMALRLPKGTRTDAAPVSAGPFNLAATLVKNSPKELAILLPFNLSRLEADSTKTTPQRLRSDRFLNMTLDFYAGALMAIDSARALGLPLRVKVLDSKETKNTSDINNLKGALSKADAVVGPFFQGNVEATAELLGTVPVVSPLSKDPGKAYANLFQSIPTPEMVKLSMIEYLKAKDANIIAVVDPKKGSSRQLIMKNLPGARFVQGAATDASVRALLTKDRMNYVILESETVGVIVNTTKVLAAAQADYNIQLAVLDTNEAFDNDEVPLQRLTGLKMLYPSVTNDEETQQAQLFTRLFKEKNSVVPNQFATRGFDVTFDTILRLFQAEGFKEIMAAKTSEQVENKFEYTAINGGNYNTGVYIMQYGDGFTIKQAQ